MNQSADNKVVTLPNLITLIRLLLVPVFVVCLLQLENNLVAFLLFLVASCTDFIDGSVARATGQVSRLGKQLDPLVDRILLLAAVVCVYLVGRIPLWMLLLLIGRDLVLLVLVSYLRLAHKQPFKVAFIGKVSTALNMVGFCLLILNWPEVGGLGSVDSGLLPGWGSAAAPLGIWFLYVGIPLAWITGLYYIAQALVARAARRRRDGGRQSGGRRNSGNGDGCAGTYRRAGDRSSADRFAAASKRQRTPEQTHAAGKDSVGFDTPNALRTPGQTHAAGQDRHETRADSSKPPLRAAAAVSLVNCQAAQRSQAAIHTSKQPKRSVKQSTHLLLQRSATALKSDVQNRNNRFARDARSGRDARTPGLRKADNHATHSHLTTVLRASDASMWRARLGGILNTPSRRLLALFSLALLIAALGFYSFDSVYNYGTIHTGVRVDDIELGGLSQEEAALLIDTQLNTRASAAPVNIFASDADRQRGITDKTQHLGNGVFSYALEQIDTSATSWMITVSTLGASGKGQALAQRAYAVGRGSDFALGRLAAALFGVTLPAEMDFSPEKLDNFDTLLTRSIGVPMVNASIRFNGQHFEAVDGHGGYVVDKARFIRALQNAFLGSERDIVVPMTERKMDIDLGAAQEAAKHAQQASAEPVTVSYEDQTWVLDSVFLGSVVSAVAREEAAGNGKLALIVDPGLLKDKLPSVTGALAVVVPPVNASFQMQDGLLTVAPEQKGSGISIAGLAQQLTALLFGDDDRNIGTFNRSDNTAGNRQVSMYIGVLEPEFSAEDAATYAFSTKIGEFTTNFPSWDQGRTTNIKLAANLVNSSIIAPGTTWSFNETAGDCTAERGFVEASVIMDDVFVDGIGGGVCQVSTTIFNAVFEAGYPIEERTNHSVRMTSYPDGRDSAIAYPYADLKFQNDTKDWLLMTVTCTDSTISCALWGTPPGYQVESKVSDWREGAAFKTQEVDNPDLPEGQRVVKNKGRNGAAIDVTRIVHDSNGNLLRQTTFWSVYEPSDEIIEIGTKQLN
ncbi:MAG: VanW family protein [Coriobacteriales bacterium]|jgi:CDP-diacylglycerol--glycerol-3-phosphate 3-phosphatidyltransferase|nr:VanW family protein [Coriobacteriales bacterium]